MGGLSAMLKAENGIVGFFDIMGYQNIIDNNDIQDVATLISDTIDALPGEVSTTYFALFKDDVDPHCMDDSLDGIKTLLISDSIVIAFPFPEEMEGESKEILNCMAKLLHWATFFIYSTIFLRKAFDYGLPLRGGIDTGQYFIKDYKFAGKPIIDSYRLSASLRFSGCALTNKASESIKKLGEQPGLGNRKWTVERPIFQYLAPLATGEERLYLLDWLYFGEKIPDIRQFISNAFRAHNKDVPLKVVPIIENTEMTIRHMASLKGRSITKKL
jgi:hypothetical protein